VPGQPTGYLPHKAVFDHVSGSLYLATSDTVGPYDGAKGDVWKLDTATDTWTCISPVPSTSSDDGFGYSRADAHLQAVSILYRAQQTADGYVTEAQEYSRHLAQDAQRRRDDMLSEAHAHASRVIDEAHHQAAPEAGLPGDRPDVEADLECVRSFNDVDRAHLRDYLGALMRGANQSEQADVEADLERVRSFNDVERAHLRDYLGALMRGVNQFEQAAATTQIDLPRQPGPPQ